MGRASPQTHAKRQREFEKKEKRRRKAEKRAARKLAKENGGQDAPIDLTVDEAG